MLARALRSLPDDLVDAPLVSAGLRQLSRMERRLNRRLRMKLRCTWVCVCAIAAAAIGCRSASAKDVIEKDSTFTEKSAAATLHWNVEANGETQLVVEDESGTVVKKEITGQIGFKPNGSGEAQTVPLTFDAKSGIGKADGPDLDGEVTEVRYALVVRGKPLTGSLHVPKKGTLALVAAAKAAPASDDSKGPHGGTVQVADGVEYEVVADSDSGETRVYLVDAGAKRPKKLKLALESDEPRVVELTWKEDGYYVAVIGADKPPRKATLVIVDDDDDVHVVVIGQRRGRVLVMDTRPVYWVRTGWGPPGLARGHHKGTLDGPPGHMKDRGGPDQVKIDIHSKGGKGSKVKIKSH